MKEKITELKQKSNLNKQTKKTVLSDPDVEKHLEELQRKILLSPSIGHQTILHLYVENTTFPSN